MPEYDAPMDGYITVSVGGTRVTRVSVENGETIEVALDTGDDDE